MQDEKKAAGIRVILSVQLFYPNPKWFGSISHFKGHAAQFSITRSGEDPAALVTELLEEAEALRDAMLAEELLKEDIDDHM